MKSVFCTNFRQKSLKKQNSTGVSLPNRNPVELLYNSIYTAELQLLAQIYVILENSTTDTFVTLKIVEL